MQNQSSVTSPVMLLCVQAFQSLYGQQFNTKGGTFHIAADGTVQATPALAVELLDLRHVPDGEPKEREVFVTLAPEDAVIVQAYRDNVAAVALAGEDKGPLVVLECLTFAGQTLGASDGQTLEFDAHGRALVGDKVYQELRPAFGGDGSNPDPDAPAITFLGYQKELAKAQETALEGVDLDTAPPVLTSVEPTPKPAPKAPEPVKEYDPREPDTDGMGPTQPNAAAREMAQFNAGENKAADASADASPATPASVLETDVAPSTAQQEADVAQAEQVLDVAVSATDTAPRSRSKKAPDAK